MGGSGGYPLVVDVVQVLLVLGGGDLVLVDGWYSVEDVCLAQVGGRYSVLDFCLAQAWSGCSEAWIEFQLYFSEYVITGDA